MKIFKTMDWIRQTRENNYDKTNKFKPEELIKTTKEAADSFCKKSSLKTRHKGTELKSQEG
jgi:hypothetical protein